VRIAPESPEVGQNVAGAPEPQLVGRDDDVGAVVRFLDSRRHQHFRQNDSELNRREAVVRDHYQVGFARDAQRVDRRANAHQVVVA